MVVQQIFVYLTVIVAIAFLVRKFIWKPKSKKDCGNDDCACH
ncbi:MAG: FeoB-associated Cys-rich membrane protein [Flavobacterium sp.]|nr:FeoB-associated Cys-rich membrane protein [Flavobacterium sp.]